MTWWSTPVEHPGQGAGPKIPDDERKASRRGQPAYGGALAEVDVFDNVPQYNVPQYIQGTSLLIVIRSDAFATLAPTIRI